MAKSSSRQQLFIVLVVCCWWNAVVDGQFVEQPPQQPQCSNDLRENLMLAGIQPPAKYLGHRASVASAQECYDACCSWNNGDQDRCNAAVYYPITNGGADCLILQCEPFKNCLFVNAEVARTNGSSVARVWRRLSQFDLWSPTEAPVPSNADGQAAQSQEPDVNEQQQQQQGDGPATTFDLPLPVPEPDAPAGNFGADDAILVDPWQPTEAPAPSPLAAPQDGGVDDSAAVGVGTDGEYHPAGFDYPMPGVDSDGVIPAANDGAQQVIHDGAGNEVDSTTTTMQTLPDGVIAENPVGDVSWNDGQDPWDMFGGAQPEGNAAGAGWSTDVPAAGPDQGGQSGPDYNNDPQNWFAEGFPVVEDKPTRQPIVEPESTPASTVPQFLPIGNPWQNIEQPQQDTQPENAPSQDAWAVVGPDGRPVEEAVNNGIDMPPAVVDVPSTGDVAAQDVDVDFQQNTEPVVVADEAYGEENDNYNGNWNDELQAAEDAEYGTQDPGEDVEYDEYGIKLPPPPPAPEPETIQTPTSTPAVEQPTIDEETEENLEEAWNEKFLQEQVLFEQQLHQSTNTPGFLPVQPDGGEYSGDREEGAGGFDLGSPPVIISMLSILVIGTLLVVYVCRRHFRSTAPRYTPLRESKVEPPTSSSYLIMPESSEYHD